MNYLLIEEKAWRELQAKGKRAIDKLRELERHFNLKGDYGWLDNDEVCRCLSISKRALQYYRDSGIIPYSFIGKKCYYKAEDIQALLGKGLITTKGK